MKKIIAFLLAVLLLCCTAFADEIKLTVSGSGMVYMEADQVSATLGVMLSGKDLAEVQAQVNETVAKVCEALEQAGLDEKDISTNYIYVSPLYDYDSRGDEPELAGYTVNNSLSILTSDTDAIGMYIDTAFEAGANQFDSIAFSVKDDSEAKDKALELAVKDAFRKAEVIAAASGKNLEGVLEINEGYQNNSYNNGSAAYKMAFDEAAAGIETTVRAAQVSVSANVQITFEIK